MIDFDFAGAISAAEREHEAAIRVRAAPELVEHLAAVVELLERSRNRWASELEDVGPFSGHFVSSEEDPPCH